MLRDDFFFKLFFSQVQSQNVMINIQKGCIYHKKKNIYLYLNVTDTVGQT